MISIEEFGSYAYGLPEDQVAPATLTRWIAGESIELDELLSCLRGDAVTAAAASPESMAVVRLALERLETRFAGRV